jgi:hypothetical protein
MACCWLPDVKRSANVTSAFPIIWLIRHIHAQLGTFRNPQVSNIIYHIGFKSSSWPL